MTDLLAATTDMGAVTLDVADLDAMTRYYVDGVGLDVLSASASLVELGRIGRASVVLRHAPGLRHAAPGSAGLFHTAVLFETRAALASAVVGVASRYPGSFTGSSDHLVSDAFYFDDPEGNGVELYWDRPRDEWAWHGTTVQMSTRALDPNRFLAEHLTDAPPVTAATVAVGHVHLKVGDIATARRFYLGTVGFEETMGFGDQALFVSAGGYHHHVGMNTWSSSGAGPRTPALGLGQVSVRVPDADSLAALRDRLRVARVAVRDDGAGVAFEDPWRNAVIAAPPSAPTRLAPAR